jgi:type I restriction enzyme M protein
LEQLNQYYTKSIYGDKLIQSLNLTRPKVALDIGFGSGNLLHAAKRRWNDLSLVGVDVDNENIANARSKKLIQAVELNGFDPSLPEIIYERFGPIDLLVGNPPYYSRELDTDAKTILKSIGLLDCLSKHIKKVPAELIFLAQNLRILSKVGELGLIVPAGLVSGERWIKIREFLFTNYHVSNVIQLPTDSFKSTDAQTFMLIISRKSTINTKTTLSHTSELKVLNINVSDAIIRADYGFYRETKGLIKLESKEFYGLQLYRGNKSFKELAEATSVYMHSTRMPNDFEKKSLSNSPLEGAKNTKPGDILIARVGRRCLGRVVYVKEGNIPVSDCIIGIRPNSKKIGKEVLKKLSSSHFRNYLQQTSFGVSAKYITYQTINDYLSHIDNAPT